MDVSKFVYTVIMFLPLYIFYVYNVWTNKSNIVMFLIVWPGFGQFARRGNFTKREGQGVVISLNSSILLFFLFKKDGHTRGLNLLPFTKRQSNRLSVLGIEN